MNGKYPPVDEALLQEESEHSEYRKKANEVYQDKINTQYDEMQRRHKETKIVNNIDLSIEARTKEIGKVQVENDEYLLH